MRHNDAFNTDDPLLIAVGQAYRDSIEQQWDYDTQVAAIQAAIEQFMNAPVQVMVARPQNAAIVASSPTVQIVSVEPDDSDEYDDDTSYEADPTYVDDSGWDTALYDPESLYADDPNGRSLEDLS